MLVTEIAGLFTEPGHVIRSPGGEVRQPFSVLFRARAVGGVPHGDRHETSDAAWIPLADLPALPVAPPVRIMIPKPSPSTPRPT